MKSKGADVLGPFARVGRRADYNLGTHRIHNGIIMPEVTAAEFADWQAARYTDRLAELGLIADSPEALIPTRNGILWDLDDVSKPAIRGIATENDPEQAPQVFLTEEELTLWKQANGVRLLSELTDCPWPMVIRLVSCGVWSLHWSREALL